MSKGLLLALCLAGVSGASGAEYEPPAEKSVS